VESLRPKPRTEHPAGECRDDKHAGLWRHVASGREMAQDASGGVGEDEGC
jgi:hypothetical protein